MRPLSSPTEIVPSGRRLAAFAAVALVLLAVAFRDSILHGHVLSQSDVLLMGAPWSAHRPAGFVPEGNVLLGDVPTVFYPFLVFARDRVRHLEWPLWNPSIYAGHPFFASFQSAVLSPFTAIAYVVPLPAATVLMAGAKLLVGGLGMFAFLSALRVGWAGAAFGGVAYLLNPFSVVWLEHPLSAVAAWLPWVLWGTRRLAARPGGSNAVILGSVIACAILAGHPETVAKVLLLTGAYGIVEGVAADQRRRALVWTGVAYGLGAVATSVQLLPFVEYLQLSRIYELRAALPRNPFFLGINTLITAVVPDFYGNPVDGVYLPMKNRLGYMSNYCEQQVYAGVMTWVLAGVGAVAGRGDRAARFFIASGVCAALIAYGIPGVFDAVTAVPLFGRAMMTRFGLLVICSASVLAGVGVGALVTTGRPQDAGAPRQTERRVPGPGPRFAALAAFCVAGFATAGIVLFLADRYRLLSMSGMWSASVVASGVAIAVSLLAAVTVAARAREALSGHVFAAIAIALVGGELLWFAEGFHPAVPPDRVFPSVPEIEAVRGDPEVVRAIGWGDHLLPNSAMVFGLHDVRGYDGMAPARYAEFLDLGLSAEPSFHRARRFEPGHLLDLLNVKYVFTPPGVALPADHFTRVEFGASPVYLNTRVLPRAFLVGACEVASGAEARAILRDGRLDFKTTVLLEEAPAAGHQPQPPGAAASSARVVAYADTRVEIETEAAVPQMLVLTDAMYPGWLATVDGEPVKIYRANYAFRAVPVPAGRHTVFFSYRPRSLFAGQVLSSAAILAMLGLLAVDRRAAVRRRREIERRPRADDAQGRTS